jgi:hypothetical protein
MKRAFYKPQYFYIAAVFVGVCLVGVSYARGQEPAEQGGESDTHSSASTSGEAGTSHTEDKAVRMETQQEKRDARKETVSEKLEERKAVLTERIQNRIFNLTENMSTRMTAAVGRLRDIAKRIESRIQKLEERGVDTGVTADLLGDIFTGLDLAESKLQALPSQVEAAVSSDNPREAFKAVRASYKEVHVIIRRAHALLRDAVSLLKEAVRTAELGRGVSDAVSEHTDDDGHTLGGEYAGGESSEDTLEE